jgi:hypothetical protein
MIDRKPKIKIDTVYSFPEDDDGSPPDKVFLRVRNFSKFSITFSYAFIQKYQPIALHKKIFSKLSHSESITFGHKIYPCETIEHKIVEPGKYIEIPFHFYEIPQNWWGERVQGVVVDQLGEQHNYEFNV